MDKKTSIQIDKKIHIEFKKFCDKHGYKLSGYLEKIILEKIKTESNQK
jgi:hypothetical protein